MSQRAVAIIPARGGSKRIPRKNIRQFCGKPMIAWSIETALASRCFDRIVVSTDDEEIADIATEWGAETPFRRPENLADDHTPTRPVVNHAISEIERLYGRPELVCCIYPTAPFMREIDLREGMDLLTGTDADFAFPVTTFASAIQRALVRTASGGLRMLWPEHRLTRSQDLQEAFHDAGQFYWGRADAFLTGKDTYSDNSVPIILPRSLVHDIDTEEDWDRAEIFFEALVRQRKNPT